MDQRSVEIALAIPDGAANGDMYDVYRKNANKYDLVASGLGLSDTLVDRHAPFGSNAILDYVIACRTVDGDIEAATYAYELPVNVLRFDWESTYVELPWNVEMDESFEKSFESREHVDGSVNGYFDKAVKATGSFRSAANRAGGYDQVNAVRQLAEYSGAVFCRTKQGTAFQCNVDVSGITNDYKSVQVPISMTITAMKLTEQFQIAKSDITEG